MNEHHVMTLPYVAGAAAAAASLLTISPWWLGVLAAPFAALWVGYAAAWPATEIALRVRGEHA